MQYEKFNDVIVLRLDPDEEIIASIQAVAEKESIQLAQISGLGAIKDLTIGVYYYDDKEYHANTFSGYYEITTLTGTVAEMDGKPYIHAHLNAGDEKGQVIGGHLNRAVVSATAEIILRQIDGHVGRKYSDAIGLNLFEF